MGKWIWKYILLLVLIVGTFTTNAQVTTESELRNAISKGGTVILGADIELGSTLEISNDVILDLNGNELSLHTVNSDAIAVRIVTGEIIIKGDGTIFAQASWKVGSWSSKYNAISVSFDGGKVSIYDAKFLAEKYLRGTAYTLDPNNGNKLKDMIPFGAYVVGGANYDSEGLEASSTTVALTQYTATFDLNGKNAAPVSDINYTIETGFTLPQLPSITGYDMEKSKWVRETGTEEYNGVPVLTDRESTGTIQYKAEWVPINYSITYDTAGGKLGESVKTSYTVEDETFTLPNPTRDNYEFVGWYDENGEKKERIVQGTTGDLVLTARWIPLYTVNYEYDKTIFEVTTLKQEFSTTMIFANYLR